MTAPAKIIFDTILRKSSSSWMGQKVQLECDDTTCYRKKPDIESGQCTLKTQQPTSVLPWITGKSRTDAYLSNGKL